VFIITAAGAESIDLKRTARRVQVRTWAETQIVGRLGSRLTADLPPSQRNKRHRLEVYRRDG
jgi:hypothetical protein